ncbi:MAG: 50S ribosomal protein L19, partial [Bacteroidetes bacterium]|nr:50S ribosomal protein L19 [Bacteroidota bacterium]
FVDNIEVNKVGRVRRAKLYYQRDRKGKASRIAEKRLVETAEAK